MAKVVQSISPEKGFSCFPVLGINAAHFLETEDDCRITAIIERDGAIINEDGLNVGAVRQHIVETGGVEGFAGADYLEDGIKALERACDILIPAALEGVITAGNAPRIQAKLIAEAANGPVTFEADRILREKGVEIIPDAYCNAGGVIVSYFEWIRNLNHVRFGRLDKRFHEARGQHVIDAIEQATNTKVPEHIVKELARGADEFDLLLVGAGIGADAGSAPEVPERTAGINAILNV